MKTQIKPAVLALAFLTSPGFQLRSFAQGDLEPPSGIPGPTFKTLTQVEPRTAITSTGATTISTSGSYYLANNVTVSSGDAITIAADNVTLDLNGFTISSNASPAAGTGIEVGNRTGVTITNGFILGGVTQSGGIFSGNGFMNGIRCALFTAVRNTTVSRVTVRGCLGEGIFLSDPFGQSNIVQSCVVDTVGGLGIGAALVSDSIAINCGFEGIQAAVASHSRGTTVGSGDGVSASTADHCIGSSVGGTGLEATVATGCQGFSTSGSGITASVADNCYGNSSSGKGLLAYYSADNCYGNSSTGNGLEAVIARGCIGKSFSASGLVATTAESCQGSSTGTGTGLSATNASNCQGSSAGGTGLSATDAANCRGSSSGAGTGLSATTVDSCSGVSSGSGTGVSAVTAQNCQGVSTSGFGMVVQRAANGCYGSGVTGISLSGVGPGGGVATNCYGISSGNGHGILGRIAIGCYGTSPNSFGINVFIANSCDGSGSPFGVSATHRYDMP